MILMMLCALLVPAARAEETIPTLPGQFTLDRFPAGETYTVYSGPGEEYLIGGSGKAKVSTNDVIRCYGRIGESSWLLVEYDIGGGRERIGCIDAGAHMDLIEKSRRLEFASVPLVLRRMAIAITDDPDKSAEPLGMISGDITLLAWKRLEWAYVEGELDGTDKRVRGFIRRDSLNDAGPAPDLPVTAYFSSRFLLMDEYDLNLRAGATADGMTLRPLADGSLLVSYRLTGSDKIWLRVVSRTGRKLFAKSVSDDFLHQITLTATGFICDVYDDSEICSGMRYTYTCQGKKWKSEKLKYVDDPDRFYSDSTEHFTVRRYPFCEGSIIPMQVTCNATGAATQQLMSVTQGNESFLYETEGQLLLFSRDEGEALSVRIFDADAREVVRIPAPEGMTAPVQSAVHSRQAVHFFTGHGSGWQVWRLDRERMAFDAEPVTVTLPQQAVLSPLAASAHGRIDLVMTTDFGSWFCQMAPDGTVSLYPAVEGRVVQAIPLSGDEAGTFLLLVETPGGDFVLRHFGISEG